MIRYAKLGYRGGSAVDHSRWELDERAETHDQRDLLSCRKHSSAVPVAVDIAAVMPAEICLARALIHIKHSLLTAS
jgi:hypothetical protein